MSATPPENTSAVVKRGCYKPCSSIFTDGENATIVIFRRCAIDRALREVTIQIET
jgi:hypothetical protein